MKRRRFITTVGAVGAIVVGAGCTGTQQGGDGNSQQDSMDSTTGSTTPQQTATSDTSTNGNSNGATEVAAGPNGNLVFTPEMVEISVGDTVTWTFESAGHNVSAKPKDHPEIEIPDGADPFASYEGHKSYQVVPKGQSYEHTFETAGTYTYVCTPHASSGMVGTVTVSK